MRENEEKKVLPADVYDTLELSAEAYGGIGDGAWYSYDDASSITPCCVHGHACLADPEESYNTPTVRNALYLAGIAEGVNDLAVQRINARKQLWGGTRVTFEEWATELNVVRGE